jgi:hypothetical protein
MRAEVGHRVIVDGHHVGDPPREGTVLEVLPDDRGDHYRVQWDAGGQSILFPQSDCRIVDPESGEQIIAVTELHAHTIDLRTAGTDPESTTRTAEMLMLFDEDETHTEARVRIKLRDYELTGFGRARRHPHDTNVSAVGEELAAARALADLSHQLLDLATFQLEKREGRTIRIDL